MTDPQLRALPGIGKDLAARIRELTDTGTSSYHKALLEEFPPTMLELPAAAGRGAQDRGAAALDARGGQPRRPRRRGAAGRIRAMPGMGAKKRGADPQGGGGSAARPGRHLLADTAAVCDELVQHLRSHDAAAEFIPWAACAAGGRRAATSTCSASAATARP
jgi:DNA polymerase (family 10)